MIWQVHFIHTFKITNLVPQFIVGKYHKLDYFKVYGKLYPILPLK